ncbi:Isoquinoline 1-oxidoreductase subunit [Indioceanicola profundi]|uniref:Isoquinoline 1-oxidoreductase subunit n=1 Tax=Indioceanicola profundi TaxID=2220096 RepID=UPI000E6AB1D7|nr:Isoquinoline 1-oxidoreductase subunit [Indioceanicola profundi]
MPLPYRRALQVGLVLAATAVATEGVTRSGISKLPHAANVERSLLAVGAFSSIADVNERSRALFKEAAKVITDPRCMNCHPSSRQPTQGDDMRPHIPFMQAGLSGIGVDGMTCNTCHRAENTVILGSRIGSVPGNSHWMLAPASMGWQDRSLGDICRQIKDPVRNGGRSLAQIRTHMAEDHLVGWAWHPGAGRRPAPGTQAEFADLISAWIETGAACPE